MIKRLLYAVLALVFAIIVVAVPLKKISDTEKIADLCENIERNNNTEAIAVAKTIKNLNRQSSIFPKLALFLEAEVTTPLVKACETGNGEMIIWLLDHGAKTDYAPNGILYPLEAFCDNGGGAGDKALRALLKHGADPETYTDRPPVFRLAQTLRNRKEQSRREGIEMIMTLVNAGASWKDPTDGYTLLHYAAMQENAGLMIALLQKEEANKYLDMPNDIGQTPLDIATEQNKILIRGRLG